MNFILRPFSAYSRPLARQIQHHLGSTVAKRTKTQGFRPTANPHHRTPNASTGWDAFQQAFGSTKQHGSRGGEHRRHARPSNQESWIQELAPEFQGADRRSGGGHGGGRQGGGGFRGGRGGWSGRGRGQKSQGEKGRGGDAFGDKFGGAKGSGKKSSAATPWWGGR